MTDYSVFVFFILLLPVTIQIILPLLMLAGFGLVRFVRIIFGTRNVSGGVRDEPKINRVMSSFCTTSQPREIYRSAE